MKNRLLFPIFAVTLFLSAFLIFSVQPMAGRFLLPLLGGSPSVWNTAMVFFQAALLAGYAYAHFIAKFLPLRLQAVLHLAFLAFFALWLPFAVPDGALPPDDGQAVWQIGLMTAILGGPFFVLAASAPLFQHWLASAKTDEPPNPYPLYAVSNAGSMLALLLYPTLFEPLFGLHEQSKLWAAGYGSLVLLTILCVFMVRNGAKPILPLSSNMRAKTLSWKTRTAWVFFAFVPSSLMLGVTTIITTDIASAPFLWVIPLALYLLSFIFAFSRSGENMQPVTRFLAGYAVCFSVLALMVTGSVMMLLPLLVIHLVAFFICALFCHAELARLRPGLPHLTEYYLLIAVGGVLGGAFNALLAPEIFSVPLEYPLTLATVGFTLWAINAKLPPVHDAFVAADDPSKPYKLMAIDAATILLGVAGIAYIYITNSAAMHAVGILGIFLTLVLLVKNRPVFAFLALAALVMFEPSLSRDGQSLVKLERNYFGVLKVTKNGPVNSFYHGTTLHGFEWRDGPSTLVPTSYYDPDGPAGDVFQALSLRKGSQKIAALGLGVGSIACYDHPGRIFDFYEIDADVVRIARDEKYFSYLSRCGKDDNIIVADARRGMRNAKNGSYDLIFIDTFSSDNIPVHIITREAIALYRTKLKPDGFIVINISNRYLDLRPQIAALAQDAGLTAFFKAYDPQRKKGTVSSLFLGSSYAVIAPSAKDVASLIEDHEWMPYMGQDRPRLWTDDYANILSALSRTPQ